MIELTGAILVEDARVDGFETTLYGPLLALTVRRGDGAPRWLHIGPYKAYLQLYGGTPGQVFEMRAVCTNPDGVPDLAGLAGVGTFTWPAQPALQIVVEIESTVLHSVAGAYVFGFLLDGAPLGRLLLPVLWAVD